MGNCCSEPAAPPRQRSTRRRPEPQPVAAATPAAAPAPAAAAHRDSLDSAGGSAGGLGLHCAAPVTSPFLLGRQDEDPFLAGATLPQSQLHAASGLGERAATQATCPQQDPVSQLSANSALAKDGEQLGGGSPKARGPGSPATTPLWLKFAPLARDGRAGQPKPGQLNTSGGLPTPNAASGRISAGLSPKSSGASDCSQGDHFNRPRLNSTFLTRRSSTSSVIRSNSPTARGWRILRRRLAQFKTTTKFLWTTMVSSVGIIERNAACGGPYERTPEEMIKWAKEIEQWYNDKTSCTFPYEELVENFRAPEEGTRAKRGRLSKLAVAAYDRLASSCGETVSVSEILFLLIYTQEGPDIDREMGFPDVPPANADEETRSAYTRMYQDRRLRNPRCSPAVPGWALGAVYKVSNWAARCCFAGAGAGVSMAERQAAQRELKKWSKWMGVIFSVPVPLSEELVGNSIDAIVRLCEKERRTDTVRRLRARVGVAKEAAKQLLVFRGISGVSDADFAAHAAYRADSRLGWTTPASTTLSEFVAKRFAGISQRVPFTEAECGDDLYVRMVPRGLAQKPGGKGGAKSAATYVGKAAGPKDGGILMQWNGPDKGGPPQGHPRTTVEPKDWWEGDGKPVTHVEHEGANAIIFRILGVTHGIRLWCISQYPEELEMLLPPFACFRVACTPRRLGAGRVLEVTLQFDTWCGDGAMKPFVTQVRKELKGSDRLLRLCCQQDQRIEMLGRMSVSAQRLSCYMKLERYLLQRQRLRAAYRLLLLTASSEGRSSQARRRAAFDRLRANCVVRLRAFKAEALKLRKYLAKYSSEGQADHEAQMAVVRRRSHNPQKTTFK
eukprot:TRINITY_DN10143_c0_g1_i1.p1 TRINITY_DN10143_c0_g1~~TRINITY_DN10143_c0_g1_i1.p1  ORF type:complete len:841 (+),score=199.55 TRINITY_DN10143_c0_g1_i1:94-2616(+)